MLENKTIALSTLLDIFKNGNDIGLNIKNEDTVDNKCRVLYLDNIKIKIIEWCEWIIRIELYHSNESLIVYQSPGLKVDWDSGDITWSSHSNKKLEVHWAEEGAWCDYITFKINAIKVSLDNHRKLEENRKQTEKRKQEEEILRKRDTFNQLFKNKK